MISSASFAQSVPLQLSSLFKPVEFCPVKWSNAIIFWFDLLFGIFGFNQLQAGQLLRTALGATPHGRAHAPEEPRGAHVRDCWP